MRRATLALLLALLGCGEEDAPAQGAAGAPQSAGGGAGASPTAGSGQVGGGAGAGAGGAGATQAGQAGAAGSSGAEEAGPRLATTLAIDEITLYQAVEVKLAAKGAVVSPRNAPVVAGREALVRVKVSPGAGFSPQKFRAELVVEAPEGAPQVLGDEREIEGDGVFSFKLEAAQVRPETRLSARLIDDEQEPHQGQEPSEARLPADGETFVLGAAWPGIALRVVLVPLRYDTDGSGRLPDLSAAQIERYRALLRATYPVINVELTVRDPVPWDESLTLSGDVKFDTLNDLLSELRFDDKAPPDVYYYGLIAPSDTLDDHCIVSCVTGQSFVVEDPEDEGSRVGAGVGFPGEDSAWTLAHELGHMHGRDHAPCDVDEWDPEFPYKNGSIGVRGHDERSGAFLEPTKTRDMMGYCEPNWVSDYTYRALFDRVKTLSALDGAPSGAAQFFTIHEEPGGAMSWGKLARRSRLPHRRHEARWVGPAGGELGPAAAARVARSHGGATWLIEPPPAGARWLDLGGAGFLELGR